MSKSFIQNDNDPRTTIKKFPEEISKPNHNPEAYSKPCKTSTMKLFAKIVDGDKS